MRSDSSTVCASRRRPARAWRTRTSLASAGVATPSWSSTTAKRRSCAWTMVRSSSTTRQLCSPQYAATAERNVTSTASRNSSVRRDRRLMTSCRRASDGDAASLTSAMPCSTGKMPIGRTNHGAETGSVHRDR